MKKFTLLFAMLIGIFSSAWAQVQSPVSRSGWSITACNTCPDGYEGENDGNIKAAIDDSKTTFYHSDWSGSSTTAGNSGLQAFMVDMGQDVENLVAFDYTGRPNSSSGHVYTCRVYVYADGARPDCVANLSSLTSSNKETVLSSSNTDLGTPVFNNSSSAWSYSANTDVKTGTFAKTTGRYILFIQDTGMDAWLTCADFNVYQETTSITYTVNSNLDEGGVVYNEQNYTNGQQFVATENITDPTTISIEGKIVVSASVDGEQINVIYGNDFIAPTETTGKLIETVPETHAIAVTSGKFYVIKGHDQKSSTRYYLNVNGNGALNGNATYSNALNYVWYIQEQISGESYYIYNVGTQKFIKVDNSVSMSDTKVGCGLTTNSSGEWAIKDPSRDLWIDMGYEGTSPGTWSGGVSGSRRLDFYEVEIVDPTTAARAELQAAINNANATIGTNPGFKPEASIKPLTEAAQAIHDDTNKTLEEIEAAITDLNTNVNAVSIIMPEEGKTYQIISALPAFEQQQGHKKAMYDNGTQMRWGQLNTESRSFYWTFTASDDKYILQNVGTERYPGVQTKSNTAVPSQEGSNTVTLASLGSAQFTLTATGCTSALHAFGHTSGAGIDNYICVWTAGLNSASAWYIVEAVAPSVDLVALEAAIATAESYQGHIGTGLGQYQGLTEETLASDITTAQGFLTSTNQEEVDAATAALNTEIGKLSLNMPTAGQYMRIKGETSGKYIGNGLSSNKYTRTTDEAEALVYFDGTTLRNVSNGGYYSSSANTWSWAEKANAKTIEFSSTQIGKYIVKCGDRYLYDADSNVDSGTSLPATTHAQYPRYTSWILESAEASAANMRISDAGWATFWAPFAVEVPAGVKAYTGELVENSWVRMIELDGVIPANAGVVVAGEEFNADLAPVEPQPNLAAESCYTGNTTGKVMNVPAGVYLLQKQDDVVGWYKVEGEGFTLAPNRCYLNVPDPNNSRPFIGFEPVDDATGISSIATEAKTKADGKYMVKGQIVVVKAGKAYNMSGTEIK